MVKQVGSSADSKSALRRAFAPGGSGAHSHDGGDGGGHTHPQYATHTDLNAAFQAATDAAQATDLSAMLAPEKEQDEGGADT